MKWIFIILVGLLLLCVFRETCCLEDDEASLQDDGQDSEELPPGRREKEADDDDDRETEAEGVSTSCMFPDNVLKQFHAGEEIEALLGFKNQNENAFHVEYIRGSLTSPVDFTYYIHNFTGSMYNTTVATGEEASIIYRFKPDVSIEPRSYGLIMQIFYTNDDNETYLSTLFNGTIDITDPLTSVDGKTVFAYISICGMLGFGGFVGLGLVKKSNAGKKFTRTTSSVVAPSSQAAPHSKDDIDWDYISPEHKQYLARQRQGGNSPGTSPPRSRNSPVRKR